MSVNQFDIRICRQVFPVHGIGQVPGPRHHIAELGLARSHFQHHRENPLDFLLAAARQNDHQLAFIAFGIGFRLEPGNEILIGTIGQDGIDQRIAFVQGFCLVGLVKPALERHQRINGIGVFLEFLDPACPPCPDLGRDIIEHFVALLMGVTRHRHIEARIINQNHDIGLVGIHILAAKTEIGKNRAQMHGHFGKSHESQIPVMLDHGGARRLHQVASPATELGLGILGFQTLD